jgi:hypothetical protein
MHATKAEAKKIRPCRYACIGRKCVIPGIKDKNPATRPWRRAAGDQRAAAGHGGGYHEDRHGPHGAGAGE